MARRVTNARATSSKSFRRASNLAKPGARSSPAHGDRALVDARIAWCQEQYLKGVSPATIVHEGAKLMNLSTRQMRSYMAVVEEQLPNPDDPEILKAYRRRLVAMGMQAHVDVVRRAELAEERAEKNRGAAGTKALAVAVAASRVVSTVQERIAKLTGADAAIKFEPVGDELDYDALSPEEAEKLDELLAKAGAKAVEP